MISKLTQRLLTLALVFVFTFCLWEIPFASANHYFTNSDEIRDNIELSKNDFTPQENQALQAIRQRRNKEIARILNSSQRQLLVHKLHNGNNIDRALDSLNLSSEQRELVNSINVFTNLKLKGIFSRHALLDSHK
jgi:ABC-type multidrug transport system fused ATPase/permease subunit